MNSPRMRDEQVILDDLAALGVHVDSVWSSFGDDIPDLAGVMDVVIAHLRFGFYSDAVREGLAHKLVLGKRGAVLVVDQHLGGTDS